MPERENPVPEGAEDFRDSVEETSEVEHEPQQRRTSTPEERVARISEFQRLQREAKTEKEKRWYQIMEEIESITDGVGRGIDRDIKESVAAFMSLEFPTSQSCDGHEIVGPWVRIYAPAPEGWRESKAKKAEWTEANEREAVRMRPLLEEFYTNRVVDDEVKIIMKPFGIFHAFQMESQGYVSIKDAAKDMEANTVRAALFKKEMDDFTAFLKEKYFSE